MTNRLSINPPPAPTANSRRSGWLAVLIMAFALFVAPQAWAVGSVLTGMFDGSECIQGGEGYRQSHFQVSASGVYSFHNALGGYSGIGSVQAEVRIYAGSFSSAAPAENLLETEDQYYYRVAVSLESGADYVLVVERICGPAEGAWVVAFTGPGSVVSADAVAVPAFSSGAFEADDPVMRNLCDDGWGTFPASSRYRQSGPVRVSQDGLYYFADTQLFGLCVLVYSAPFDRLRPDSNRVATPVWRSGAFELKAGQDYYFFVQQGHSDGPGEYFYLILPSAPFRINPGLTDVWYNPATPGQGFSLDVMDLSNEIFLGWFTFDDDPAFGEEAGQQWITALGDYKGASAKLDIEWTRDGRFDSNEPAPRQNNDGTIELEFTDCASGEIRFAWGDDISRPSRSGVIPIRRIANDSVAWCESLYSGPGMPGPL